MKQLFCQHDYHLINQFTIPSEFEVVSNHGYNPKTSTSIKSRVVSDYKCSKCNKLRRLTAKTV